MNGVEGSAICDAAATLFRTCVWVDTDAMAVAAVDLKRVEACVRIGEIERALLWLEALRKLVAENNAAARRVA